MVGPSRVDGYRAFEGRWVNGWTLHGWIVGAFVGRRLDITKKIKETFFSIYSIQKFLQMYSIQKFLQMYPIQKFLQMYSI